MTSIGPGTSVYGRVISGSRALILRMSMAHSKANPRSGSHSKLMHNVVLSVLFSYLIVISSASGLTQVLNWSSPYGSTSIGTINSTIASFGATSWHGRVWLASAVSGGYVYLYSSSPGRNLAFSSASPYALSNANSSPALAVGSENYLYIAYIDSGSGGLDIYKSPDGQSVARYACNVAGSGTPALVEFNGYIYAFYHSPGGLVSCRINTAGQVQVQTYPNYQPGSSPSATVYKNALYIAYKSNDSSNLIDLLTSTDGSTFTFSAAAQGSHTSNSPSIAVHNGYLYIGFQQNGGNLFFYTYSTNGSTFSAPIQVNFSNGGPPTLLEDSSLIFHDIFRQNSPTSYVYASDTN